MIAIGKLKLIKNQLSGIVLFLVYGHATMFIMGAPIQNPVFVEQVIVFTLTKFSTKGNVLELCDVRLK